MTDLAPLSVGDRERRMHEQLESRHLDALIVTSLANVRWLTGFAGSNATAVVGNGEVTLFTDLRYADRAPVELAAVESSADLVIARATLGDEVANLLSSAERVGLEADHVSWNQHGVIASEWLPDHELVATTAIVEELRARKDPAEVARIERAGQIVDAALSQVRSDLAQRPTEREFATSLEAAIRAGGAHDLGFSTIVASGPNSAIPHHAPTDRTIEPGDLVIVDVGAMIDGYRSDMTRTFCVGDMSPEQERHYNVVIAAQQAGVEAMVDGAATADVDAAARTVITDAGWGEAFTHGTGHGVGLDIHELPKVNKTATEHYERGTVATVEPGVYLSGVGGVRIEDTCVVTPDGAKRLTAFPKDAPMV